MKGSKVFKISVEKMIVVATSLVCSLIWAQQVQTIYSSGRVYLPQECPSDAVAVATVSLTWKDLDISEGGTGRKIVEEAIFTGKQGEKEIKFTGVRIEPSFPRGNISIEVKVEFKKGEDVLAEFRMDKKDKDTPGPVSYNEARAGKLLDLKLKLKPAEKRD